MTQHTDDQLAAWLADGPQHGPTANLQRALARARATGQRPGWLVAATGGTIAERRAGGQLRFGLVGVVVLVATLIVGAMIAGGLFNPNPNPAPSPLSSASAEVSPDATVQPSPEAAQGRIVFTRYTRLAPGEGDCDQRFSCIRSSIFTVNQDGSDELEVFPGPNSQIVTVSPDGSSMIIQIFQPDTEFELFLTDVNGSEPEALDANCQLPCVGDWGFAFSPDGSRLAFVRSYGGDPEFPGDTSATGIAIMDLATGVVVELDSTLAANPELGPPCNSGCGEGFAGGPNWSPDGEHLLFFRTGIGIPNQPRTILDTALFVVDADGGNFRQLVPTELFARDARWSPDGSLIVFTSAVEQLALNEQTGVVDNWQQLSDLYTVRPDGTDLQRLTTDTAGPLGTTDPVELGAKFPTWTRDGRIVFTRGNAAEADNVWQLWVMDADGGNQTQLDPSDAATLTAIGCVSCPYPEISAMIGYPSPAFWIPPE